MKMKNILLALSILCLSACTTMDVEMPKSNHIEYWVSEHKFVVAEGEANAQVTDSIISVQVHAIANDSINIDINEVYVVDSILDVPDSSSAKLMCPWGKYRKFKSGDCTIVESDYTKQVDRIDLSVTCTSGISYTFVVYGELLK